MGEATDARTLQAGGGYFEAWTCGVMLPVFDGSKGVSASGWVISSDGWATAVVPRTLASRAANRDQWLAEIWAIIGVLEDLPAKSRIIIFTRQKQISAYHASRWLKTSGEKGENAVDAELIWMLTEDKSLDVTIDYRAEDRNYKALKESTHSAALRRYNELPDQALLEAPPSPKTQYKNKARRGFPAVRTEKPKQR